MKKNKIKDQIWIINPWIQIDNFIFNKKYLKKLFFFKYFSFFIVSIFAPCLSCYQF